MNVQELSYKNMRVQVLFDFRFEFDNYDIKRLITDRVEEHLVIRSWFC